ncbi:hypothetical protein HY502_01530 [Candidatus Woesebacteria bacterium]|nr:hypothetical protein [Candidatus Woesebacteria bacterium]
MAIIVLQKSATKEDIKKAKEEYENYIKITVDLRLGLVSIGGEYHADAEAILLKKFGSRQQDIWGGGYNIILDKFEANAVINIRAPINDSPEILDPEIREKVLKLAKEKLSKIKSLI